MNSINFYLRLSQRREKFQPPTDDWLQFGGKFGPTFRTLIRSPHRFRINSPYLGNILRPGMSFAESRPLNPLRWAGRGRGEGSEQFSFSAVSRKMTMFLLLVFPHAIFCLFFVFFSFRLSLSFTRCHTRTETQLHTHTLLIEEHWCPYNGNTIILPIGETSSPGRSFIE